MYVFPNEWANDSLSISILSLSHFRFENKKKSAEQKAK